MSNPPRIRKRVGADPSKFKRGVDGSGFITCEKCGFSVPAGAADVHDCKLEARIKSSLECHHTIDSAVRGHSQLSRKQPRTEEVEIQKAPKCAKRPKDPNRPKKPQPAFFVFMEEFRKKIQRG
uniref:Uncharacterized protein n=1 Tax=Picea sitchensis TaxID=3332 RepID=B8LRI2_PICSI|nr:unknown [Picea sitchensis]